MGPHLKCGHLNKVSAYETHPFVGVCRSLNPLSPNSDQDRFSPNNIHTLSRVKLGELIK